MTRRDALLAFSATPLLLARGKAEPGLCVEGYIFEQYAQRTNRRLPDVVEEVFKFVRKAGYHQVELGPNFFAGLLRERTPALLRAHGLNMPSVYVGGALHEGLAAEQTVQHASEIASLCAPFGCTAVVTNPDPKRNDEAKTEAELQVEADALNRMAKRLAAQQMELRVHHHTPQLENNAREWRYLLEHTDPALVHVCVDVDWAYEGGFDPVAFLRECGNRVGELHIRSARNKIWLEDVEDSDIDYSAVAAYLREQHLQPELVVELAYRPQTAVSRHLEEDLRLSRLYVERVFKTS
jgi:inosose dehydratase